MLQTQPLVIPKLSVQPKPFYCICKPAFLEIPRLTDGKPTLHQTLLIPYVLDFLQDCIGSCRNNLLDIENQCHRYIDEVDNNNHFELLIITLLEELIATLKRDLEIINILPENVDIYLTAVWQDRDHFRFQGYLYA